MIHSISPSGLEWLKKTERLAVRPYDDQTGQPIAAWVPGATIGYGHLVAREEWPRYAGGITPAAAEDLLHEELGQFERAVSQAVSVMLAQHQFDALTILAYNIGVAAFAGSSAVKLINNPAATTRYPSLEKAWKAWNKSQGRVMAGLVKRRAAEWAMYSRGEYAHW